MPFHLAAVRPTATRVPLARPAFQVGNDNFYDVLAKVSGPSAMQEWGKLQEVMRPLAKAASMLPPTAFRCAGHVQDHANIGSYTCALRYCTGYLA